MQISEDKGAGLFISHYDENSISINQQNYVKSLVLPANSLPIREILATACEHISIDLLAPYLDCELVLIGHHDKKHPLTSTLQVALAAKGIGLEVMNFGAACRTYNVLATEGRRLLGVFLFN